MPTTYLPADEETLALAQRIIEEHHPWLEEARIAIVFREGEAPTSDGKQILGAASLVTSKMQVIAKEHFDFFIWLAGDWWHGASDRHRQALLDHELCHCTGQPYAWKMRSHDIEEFACILERHGPWYQDLHHFARVARERLATQGTLLDEKVAGLVGTINGLNRGIESIELATQYGSTVLTSTDAKKASLQIHEEMIREAVTQ